MQHIHGNHGNKNSSKGNYFKDNPEIYNKLYQHTYRNDIDMNVSDACRVLLENYPKEELMKASGKRLLAWFLYHTE